MQITHFISLFLGLIIAYLLGSIPTAVWLGKAFFKTDVRKQGSNNAGATNTARVLGIGPGLIVLFLDAAKGWFAVYCGNFFGAFFVDIWGLNTGAAYLSCFKLIMGSMAVLGHVLPIFAKFKGGKGVATTVGLVIGLFWEIFPIVIVIFIVMFMLYRYISLASITAAVSFPIAYVLCGPWLHYQVHIPLLIFACLVALFIPYTHRKNIRRLLKREEPKFQLHKHLDNAHDENETQP